MGAPERRFRYALPIGLGCCGLTLFLLAILIGFLLPAAIDEGLQTLNIVCNDDSPGYSGFKSDDDSNTKTYTRVFLYNITNPSAYLQGETAELMEHGPYVYRKRFKNLDLSIESVDGIKIASYKTWERYTFDEDRSCETCRQNTEINTIASQYPPLLTSGLSEAVILLQTVCTEDQIFAIGSAAPPCTVAQRSTNATCQCCTPGVDCAPLVDPTSSNGGALLSLLSTWDRGYIVRAGPTALFQPNIYSPLVARVRASEIFFGTPSAIFGFGTVFPTASLDDVFVQAATRFTKDYTDVCAFVCSDEVAAVEAAIASMDPATIIGTAASRTCFEYIPDTDAELAALMGLDEDSAALNQYKYLERMSCSSYPWALMGRAAAALATTAPTCTDPDVSPGEDACCMWTGEAAGTLGALKGFGCISTPGGIIFERNFQEESEAAEFLDSTFINKVQTGCGRGIEDYPAKERVVQNAVQYKDGTVFDLWNVYEDVPAVLQPSFTQSPLQTQQDVFASIRTGFVSFRRDLTGHFGSGVYPRGLNPSFFYSSDLTEGTPLNRTYTVYPVQTRRGIDFVFERRVTNRGIEAARFIVDLSQVDPTEENQRMGQGIPYKGLIASFFYYRTCFYVSVPLFAFADRVLLSQSDNTVREAPDGGGISVTLTVKDYESNELLDEPRLLTGDVLDELEERNGESSVMPYFDVEPATGLFIKGRKRIMGSYSVWDCDPNFQSHCVIMATQGTCYGSFGVGGLPCSATNVLTPLVQGGKVIPAFWSDEEATISEEDADTFKDTGVAVQASRVFLAVGTTVGALLMVIAAAVALRTPAEGAPVEAALIKASKPEQSGMDKSTPPDEPEAKGEA